MTSAFDALQRYQSAGLADEAQIGLLRSMLWSDDAVSMIDEATERGSPITIEEFEANADPRFQLDDRMRYLVMFGQFDGRINSFAMPYGDTQIEDLTAAAVARRTPMTDAEIEHLNRNVLQDPSILY